MDDERIEAQWQEFDGEFEARPDEPPDGEGDPGVADSDTAYLNGELDELYYGIASGDADPQIEESGLDQLEGDNLGI